MESDAKEGLAARPGSALSPKSGSVMWAAKEDDRPKKGWWAPGSYINQCRRCGLYFVGDKRAGNCADCAYDESPNALPSATGANNEGGKQHE